MAAMPTNPGTDMDATTVASARRAAPALEDCAVIELRDYLMQPKQRDVLIELFEREFIETQEALGMRVMAHFRDLDRPDHYRVAARLCRSCRRAGARWTRSTPGRCGSPTATLPTPR